jgi:hypothetical protein
VALGRPLWWPKADAARPDGVGDVVVALGQPLQWPKADSARPGACDVVAARDAMARGRHRGCERSRCRPPRWCRRWREGLPPWATLRWSKPTLPARASIIVSAGAAAAVCRDRRGRRREGLPPWATFWWALGRLARWLKADTARPRGASDVTAALSWPSWSPRPTPPAPMARARLQRCWADHCDGTGPAPAVALGHPLWWPKADATRPSGVGDVVVALGRPLRWPKAHPHALMARATLWRHATR